MKLITQDKLDAMHVVIVPLPTVEKATPMIYPVGSSMALVVTGNRLGLTLTRMFDPRCVFTSIRKQTTLYGVDNSLELEEDPNAKLSTKNPTADDHYRSQYRKTNDSDTYWKNTDQLRSTLEHAAGGEGGALGGPRRRPSVFRNTQFRSTLIIVDDSRVLCSPPPVDYLGWVEVSISVGGMQFYTKVGRTKVGVGVCVGGMQFYTKVGRTKVTRR